MGDSAFTLGKTLGFRPEAGYCYYHLLGQHIGLVPAPLYGKNKLLCPDLPSVTRRSSVPPPPTPGEDLTPSSPGSSLLKRGACERGGRK